MIEDNMHESAPESSNSEGDSQESNQVNMSETVDHHRLNDVLAESKKKISVSWTMNGGAAC